jgi:hypothetical protein
LDLTESYPKRATTPLKHDTGHFLYIAYQFIYCVLTINKSRNLLIHHWALKMPEERFPKLAVRKVFLKKNWGVLKPASVRYAVAGIWRWTVAVARIYLVGLVKSATVWNAIARIRRRANAGSRHSANHSTDD